MTYYEGKTLREVMRKAVRGIKQSQIDENQILADCKNLEHDIGRVDALLASHVAHARSLDNSIESLRGEQRALWVHSIVDVAVVVIPIAKILRVRKLVSAILQMLRRSGTGVNIESAIDLVIDIIGVYDAIANIGRLRALPEEIREVARDAEALSTEIKTIRDELVRIQKIYDMLGCTRFEPEPRIG